MCEPPGAQQPWTGRGRHTARRPKTDWLSRRQPNSTDCTSTGIVESAQDFPTDAMRLSLVASPLGFAGDLQGLVTQRQGLPIAVLKK